MFIGNQSLSVLIVEDEGASRLALVRLLGAMGFETHAAGTLAGARAVLARQTPDLVLLDVHLPDGDGTDLLAEIRRSGESVIVAIMTAISSERSLSQITDLEPDALFEKPVNLDEFKLWLLGELSACSDLSMQESRGHYAPLFLDSSPKSKAG